MIGFMSVSFGGSTSSREEYLRRKDEAREWKRQDREDWRREHYAGYDKLSGLRTRRRTAARAATMSGIKEAL